MGGFPKAHTYRGRRSLLKDAKKAPFTWARVFPKALVKGLSPPLFQTGYECLTHALNLHVISDGTSPTGCAHINEIQLVVSGCVAYPAHQEINAEN